MATVNRTSNIPPEVLAEMQARAERAAKGIRDPEDARRACERMDRMRERMPETNAAVDLIREVRDEA